MLHSETSSPLTFRGGTSDWPLANAGDIWDPSLIPESEIYPGKGHDNPLQYSCWEISWTDEPDELNKVHSVAKSWTWLSDLAQPSPSASKTGVLADEGKGQRLFLLLSCVWLFCDPMDGRLTRILCLWDFPGKNIGMGCLFLLQGFFPTQGSNSGLLDCRQILYCWATGAY